MITAVHRNRMLNVTRQRYIKINKKIKFEM